MFFLGKIYLSFLIYSFTVLLTAGICYHGSATLLNVLSITTSLVAPAAEVTNTSMDLMWHAPDRTEINNLSTVINGTGIYNFVFNSSVNPAGTTYGDYNWCNMPHVRVQEYVKAPSDFELAYVEVIHRHHKRTPYAANTFPIESYPWYCNDSALYYYGAPAPYLPPENSSAPTFWNVFTDTANPFRAGGFSGDCEFPQITRGGLDDSWQHGKDLYGVYHDLLHLIPDDDARSEAVSYRVTNNVITSQVAGMVINGMLGTTMSYPVRIQPPTIDSLEPAYNCPSASTLFNSYGVNSNNPAWITHLNDAAALYNQLDAVSGIATNNTGWHMSFDHYFDSLSARLCHDKALPCNVDNATLCITQDEADAVFRLGEYEYSFIYRDSPQSLNASVASYGVFVAELAMHLRAAQAGTSKVVYQHNVAHDGSLSRLLSILQIDVMVWPGMGSEVVFELYKKTMAPSRGGRQGRWSDMNPHSLDYGHMDDSQWFVRVLWSGKVLRSSSPVLGVADMIPLDRLLAYFDGLVGRLGSAVPAACGL